MPRRTPPSDLSEEDRKAWRDHFKNRNLHSVKLSDEYEEKFQVYKKVRNIETDNQALRQIIETHQDF